MDEEITREDYICARQEESYNLYKDNQYFRKARALILKDEKIVLIAYKQKNKTKYIIPGGGVEPNENPKQTVKREALEEVNMIINPIKYINKEYYTVPMKYRDIPYESKRVSYYYLCKFKGYSNNNHLGLPGEFNDDINIVTLSLDELKNTKHYYINHMGKKTYAKLIELLETRAKNKFSSKVKNIIE